jgi:hypothetical protein
MSGLCYYNRQKVQIASADIKAATNLQQSNIIANIAHPKYLVRAQCQQLTRHQ